MTPGHPRWPEFCIRMQRLDPHAGCKLTTDFAVEVLKTMGVDIAGSLQYFRWHGGECDCEIILNIILPSIEAMGQ